MEVTTSQDYRQLASDVKGGVRDYQWASVGWGLLWVALLLITIIVPLLVAAAAGLTQSPVAWIVPWIPILSIVVSGAAALNVAVDPNEHWRVWTATRDEARTLCREILDNPPTDRASWQAYSDRWADVQKRLREQLPGTSRQ
jgi:hypothetical protein